MQNSKLKTSIELAVLSFLSLFYELMIIRWLSSEIRTFAYFKNVPLMACLFGLGLGLALSRSKHDWQRWFPWSLLLLITLICFAEPLQLVHITFVDPTEFYMVGPIAAGNMDYHNMIHYALQTLKGYAVLIGIYYLCVLIFVGIGQKMGQLFDQLEPLNAYTLNVGASLLGVVSFSILSYFSLPPALWFLVAAIPTAWFTRKPDQLLALAAGAMIAFVTAPVNVTWSPYYRISIRDGWLTADEAHPKVFYGYNIDVNHDGMMGAYDNSAQFLTKLSQKQLDETLQHYNVLYKLIGDAPRSDLIIAVGAGNDVAAALRHGAQSIDAVEIDKTFVDLGRKLHPEKPYDRPNVRVTIDDARAYMQQSNKKYDLVDFAYLDSHASLSSMSSIRLDNYIYSLESMQNARRLLKPDGILAVTFYAMTWWQEIRIYKTVEQAFGEKPLAFWSPNGQALTILIGPGLNRQKALSAGFKPFDKEHVDKTISKLIVDWDKIQPTTDDWPFLFLRGREMSITYGAGLLFTLLIGWGFTKKAFGSFTADNLGRAMFCLGVGFMLLEVKSVSQMGLVLGATWLTNAFVISAVLLMILLANLLQLKIKSRNLKIPYIFLWLSLLISYFVPLSLFSGLPGEFRAVAASLFLALPIPFAAWIFAITFSRGKDASKLLGMNLLGTLIGGSMEYLSMITGISAMNLFALILYGLAYYFTFKTDTAESSVAGPVLEI